MGLAKIGILSTLLLVLVACDSSLEEGTVISEKKIIDKAITRFEPYFKPLAQDGDNRLFLTKLSGLYKKSGEEAPQLIHQFDNVVQGVIRLKSGTIIVSTDNYHKDALSPNHLWRSSDNGTSFERVHTTNGGTVFHWSFAESNQGSVFAAEYGPQKKGMSKTLWRSDDDGLTWRESFKAVNENGVHLHRVKKDPFTHDLWLTQGDDKFAMLYRSQDNGDSWQEVVKSQATDIAFTQEHIYLGEDTIRVGRIGRIDRATLKYEPNWFRAEDYGNYSGSVYALTKMKDEPYLLLANMKYENEDHIAALIKININDPSDVAPILHLESIAGFGKGLDIAVGPLEDGSIYWPGWRYGLR